MYTHTHIPYLCLPGGSLEPSMPLAQAFDCCVGLKGLTDLSLGDNAGSLCRYPPGYPASHQRKETSFLPQAPDSLPALPSPTNYLIVAQPPTDKAHATNTYNNHTQFTQTQRQLPSIIQHPKQEH